MFLTAPAVEVVTALRGFALPAAGGVRDDVLSASFAAVAILLGYAGAIYMTLASQVGTGITRPMLILLLDTRRSPRERIHELLAAHVPEANPLA